MNYFEDTLSKAVYLHAHSSGLLGWNLGIPITVISVAHPDPGSDAFLTLGPGSGIRNRFFPHPGSQTHIFEG
jgi:hypothetical protein